MSFFSEFASYQSLKFESISVEAFTFGKDQYVVFAQPFAGTCSFLEWDHVEMTFRTYDTIESEFINKSIIDVKGKKQFKWEVYEQPYIDCFVSTWFSPLKGDTK